MAAAAAASPGGAVLLPPATLADARLLFATAGAPAHDYPGHAECAARVPAILEALQARGLTERAGQVAELTGFAAAPRGTIQLVHSEGYVAGLARASQKCADSSTTLEVDFAPTYITASTADDACLVSRACALPVRPLLQPQQPLLHLSAPLTAQLRQAQRQPSCALACSLHGPAPSRPCPPLPAGSRSRRVAC